jgi:integrase
VLAPSSINKTITRLAQVLEEAVEYSLLSSNPARGKRRRLKAPHQQRARLEAEQVAALLQVAGTHRTLLAVAIMCGGLRASEITGLCWRDVHLASATLTVAASKTEAGVRRVQIPPGVLDELKAHKVAAPFADRSDYVFPTSTGKRRERNSARTRILYPAVTRANVILEDAGCARIPDGVTFHSLRRTFASLLFEQGADPAFVRAQNRHRTAALTLEVYADATTRRHPANDKLDALLEWPRATTVAETTPPRSA